MNLFWHYARTDAERLGDLAGDFRSDWEEGARCRIAAEYAEVVDRLIAGGDWDEAPSIEAWLPDEYMPKAFYDYWMSDDPDAPPLPEPAPNCPGGASADPG